MNIGNKGNIKKAVFCVSILNVKFKVPVNNTTNNIAELNINS